MVGAMVRRVRELAMLLFFALFSKASSLKPYWPRPSAAHCLSWRLAVETNNVDPWRTVPAHCFHHIAAYITGGQYQLDLRFIVDQILSYADRISVSGDGMDAWILDVDDTCISNVEYYRGKRFGCEPYDAAAFRAWAVEGGCPAITAVVEMYGILVKRGFKVFLISGRDEVTMGEATMENLAKEGFVGYERLMLRTSEYRGQSAVEFKSEMRRKMVEEGYKIWGNVGDQWSDIQGQFVGNRTFKLPNPMYFVP